jgi:16S rRNA (guanine527-N7)-methyltransferase
LAVYVGLITKWNATINLTALTLSPLSDEALDRLIVEPLLAARELPAASALPALGAQSGLTHIRDRSGTPAGTGEVQVLLDIGSGGGSPAIPLKIVRPDFQLTMVESKTRKSAFLRDVARQLSLAAVVVLTDRLENLVQGEAREGLPVENRPVPLCGKLGAAAISLRAVRADQGLWDSVGALLRPSGVVLWFRSEASGAGPLPSTGIELAETKPLIPELGSELAVLRKVAS